MGKLIRIVAVLFLLAVLASCYSPGTFMGPGDMNKPLKLNGRNIYPHFIPITPDLTLLQDSFKEYRVGLQDILFIIVWNHPELTIPSMQTTSENMNIYAQMNQTNNNPAGILIDTRGNIFFPLAGKVNVSGLTVDQIRSRITAKLIKYIRNPQVSVRVSAFRSKPIYLIGEILKPGTQYMMDVPLTIMDAINNAGGLDKESSDPHYIYVIRGDYRQPTIYWLNASTPSAILMAERFQLRSRDIILVSTAGVVRYSRLINRILPTIQTLTNPVITSNDYYK